MRPGAVLIKLSLFAPRSDGHPVPSRLQELKPEIRLYLPPAVRAAGGAIGFGSPSPLADCSLTRLGCSDVVDGALSVIRSGVREARRLHVPTGAPRGAAPSAG